MMDDVMAFIASAIIIEGLVSYAGMVVKDKKFSWEIVCTIAIGCVVAFNANLDFFTLLGIPEKYSAIGTLLTGVLLSRGSNYVYDLYDKLTNWKRGNSEE